ncbi:MAG TPA: DUF4920 domain-containing protein, partial [Gracilimonas sp.]|uniref:DUF4920 domain-containing protein n=1 Tax=Gracilimonas sp. TaxID=1974203 RepID=UPI002D9E5755|nr:DUF4920 domain-containing protein [Gracilimonas sp.]
MRSLLIPIFALLISTFSYAQESEVIRLSDPVQVTQTHEVFGSEVNEWAEPRSLMSVIEKADELSGKELTIETEIAQVCEKKGCFFVANDGAFSARITFKDYGFFIPTDSKGKTVKLIGVFNVKELTEDQAKHYAEDAGEDPDMVKGPQKEYSIVATSVKIPKS